MIGIYKITSPSGRIYIGQSTNIKRRLTHYMLESCSKQTKLYRSFKKYGAWRHHFEVVTECEQKDLNDLERYYQLFFNCIKDGLNCTLTCSTDKSGRHSDETKKRISESKKGYKWSAETRLKMSNNRIGHKHTEEAKRKIGNAHRGKVVSEETKNKLRGRTRICSQETRRKLRMAAALSVKWNARLTLDLETGIYYDCAKEAGIARNISYGNIRSYLSDNNRKNKSNLIYC